MNAVKGLLLAALAVLLAGIAGYHYGDQAGRAAEAGARDAKALQGLTTMIDQHRGLVDQSRAASREMRSATAARQARDAQTTEEFRNALAITASGRADCVFPPDVMRQLAAARDRAAATAASGVLNSVPSAATGPDR